MIPGLGVGMGHVRLSCDGPVSALPPGGPEPGRLGQKGAAPHGADSSAMLEGFRASPPAQIAADAVIGRGSRVNVAPRMWI